jgi:hypothetical protein
MAKSMARKKTAPPKKAPTQKAPRRQARQASISPRDRISLYAAARYLPASVHETCGLRIPFTTYFQDPSVARQNPELAFDEEFLVDWEPGLADGPTSARFAVVDYNADTGKLMAPAEWDETLQRFTFEGKELDRNSAASFQFHQVSVWAQLQRALEFFEDGNGLGRRIPWAFEGNRLIVVPHAGYGENAFYDRSSKSLQFYYFGSDEETVFTCLSADVVNHEFGHAVLDGIRPLYNESSSVQTAAFHEFMGDLTAILLTLRNNELRRQLAEQSKGNIAEAKELSSLAEEFGVAVSGRPYLRTALRKDTLSDLAGETSPHRLSQVMTGAMFDVLMRVAEHYRRNDPHDTTVPVSAVTSDGKPPATPKQAFWRAAERMQRMAIQPLDLLPPVEVTFRDYALAVCRAEQLANPLDPFKHYDMLIDVFLKRGILTAEDKQQLKRPQYLYDRLRLSVPHHIDDIARSRAAAYRFLDDNREDLLIPATRDFVIADLYDANKLARQNAPMPRQIVLEYVWREDVLLEGPQFDRFKGQVTTMLCGGTLVFNDDGIVLSWAMKPGSLPYGGKTARRGAIRKKWDDAVAEGLARRAALLENLAAQIAAGQVGSVVGSAKGILGTSMPPLIADEIDGAVQFQLSPHLHLSDDHQLEEADQAGERQWEISC